MIYEHQTHVATHRVAGFEDYLEAIRKRRLLVAGCVVLMVLLSFAYTQRRVASYKATASVLLYPTPVGTANDALSNPQLDRESQILASTQIGDAARERLAPKQVFGGVSTSFVPGSDAIQITATAGSPSDSAALASAYAAVYVERRVDDQQTYYQTRLASLGDELVAVNQTIADGEARLAVLDQQRADIVTLGSGTAEESASRQAILGQIATERELVNVDLNPARGRKAELERNITDLNRTLETIKPAAVLISEAQPPAGPAGVSDMAFWILGAILGLMIGVAAAFIAERLDRSAQTTRDVERALGGRVAGTVPRFDVRSRRGRWALVMINGRSNAASQRARESFRRLRSSVMFLHRADQVRCIVVTSNRPGEGKSTVSANLALAMALGGTRTALVSADMRRSSLEGSFSIDNDRGLSTYLSGRSAAIRSERIDGVDYLSLIPSGPEPTNPGELLGSDRFVSLIDHLRSTHDLVIIDTPPLGATADALACASISDGVLVVVDGAKTETTDLLEVRNELDRTGIRLLGAVLNRDTSQPKGIFGKRSRYGYYTTEQGAASGGDAAELSTRSESFEVEDAPLALDATRSKERARSSKRDRTDGGGSPRSTRKPASHPDDAAAVVPPANRPVTGTGTGTGTDSDRDAAETHDLVTTLRSTSITDGALETSAVDGSGVADPSPGVTGPAGAGESGAADQDAPVAAKQTPASRAPRPERKPARSAGATAGRARKN